MVNQATDTSRTIMTHTFAGAKGGCRVSLVRRTITKKNRSYNRYDIRLKIFKYDEDWKESFVFLFEPGEAYEFALKCQKLIKYANKHKNDLSSQYSAESQLHSYRGTQKKAKFTVYKSKNNNALRFSIAIEQWSEQSKGKDARIKAANISYPMFFVRVLQMCAEEAVRLPTVPVSSVVCDGSSTDEVNANMNDDMVEDELEMEDDIDSLEDEDIDEDDEYV